MCSSILIYIIQSIAAFFYYVSMEKILEHEIFKLKKLKRLLGENTILATRVWPNGNYDREYRLQSFRK